MGKFYIIENVDIPDCYYDFELDTWGDGLCKNNLLPSAAVAGVLMLVYEIGDGQIVEIDVE